MSALRCEAVSGAETRKWRSGVYCISDERYGSAFCHLVRQRLPAGFIMARKKWGGITVPECDCDGCDNHYHLANQTIHRGVEGCVQACQEDGACKMALFREEYPSGAPANHCYLYFKGAKKIAQRCV